MENPKHIIVVSCLVRDDEGRVLLVRHRKRGWELPQGRVEEGESLMDALNREVLEETGAEVEPGPLAAVWSKLSPPTAVIFTFLARYRRGELQPSEETPDLGWFAAGEAPALVSHPVNRDRLLALLEYSGAVVFRAYATSPYRITVPTPIPK